MRADLMEIICCPMCHGDLVLDVEREVDGEIIEGALTCTGCSERFTIDDGIPDLRPPDMRDL
jgi:uncharacterized protein YbaR (Trm112 family)